MICRICNIDKTEDNFYLRKETKNRKTYKYYRSECKLCLILRSKDNYFKNFDRRRITKKLWTQNIFMPKLRLKLYGLTTQEYNEMLKANNGNCYICNEPREVINVDHCHSTGKIRGLLCQACNLGLGNFRDNIKYLKNAIKYLEKSVSGITLKSAKK